MFLRMMICIVVIAIAAPFFIPGPNGTPIFTLDMFSFEKPSLPSFVGSENEASGSQTLYRYQDEQGVWHYTDQPLVDGAIEEIEVSTDINLIDAPPELPRNSAPAANISANPLSAVTRGAEVLEDAEQVQQMLDDRLDNMDETLNSIQ